MKKVLLFCCFFVLGLLILIFSNTSFIISESPGTQTTIPLLKEFDLKKDSFRFKNYKKKDSQGSYKDLTVVEMERLFSKEKICSNIKDIDIVRNDGVNNKKTENNKNEVQCILTPQAEAWMKRVNQAMDEGHCEGMAALSLALYEDRFKNSKVPRTPMASKIQKNAKETHDLLFETPEVPREIAYWYASQFTFPTSLAEENFKTYGELVERLKEGAEKDDPYTMALYWKGGGGHLVTPYEIRETKIETLLFKKYRIPKKPFKKYKILNYDNEYPGEPTILTIDNPDAEIININSTRGKNSKKIEESHTPPRVRRNGAEDSKIASVGLIKNNWRQIQQSELFTLVDNQVWTQEGTDLTISAHPKDPIISGDPKVKFEKVSLLEKGKDKASFTFCPKDKPRCYSEQQENFNKETNNSIFHIPTNIPFKLTAKSSPEQKEPKSISLIGPDYYFAVKGIEFTSTDEAEIEFAPLERFPNEKDSNSQDKKPDYDYLSNKNGLYKSSLRYRDSHKANNSKQFEISAGFDVKRIASYKFNLAKIRMGSQGELNFNLHWGNPENPKQFISLENQGKNNTEIGLISMIRRPERGEETKLCSSKKIILEPKRSIRIEHGEIKPDSLGNGLQLRGFKGDKPENSSRDSIMLTESNCQR